MNLNILPRIVAGSALALILSGQTSGAQADVMQAKHQYNAKMICSLFGTFGDGFLAQGTYRTVINIGNPSKESVKFAVKPIIAGGLGSGDQNIEGVVPKRDELPPHGAVAIDCGTLAGFFCPTADGLCFDFTAIDGFIKILSTAKLDVVAVYTARPTDGEVSTMDVEPVEGHEVDMEMDVTDVDEPPTYQPRMKMRGDHEGE